MKNINLHVSEPPNLYCAARVTLNSMYAGHMDQQRPAIFRSPFSSDHSDVNGEVIDLEKPRKSALTLERELTQLHFKVFLVEQRFALRSKIRSGIVEIIVEVFRVRIGQFRESALPISKEEPPT